MIRDHLVLEYRLRLLATFGLRHFGFSSRTVVRDLNQCVVVVHAVMPFQCSPKPPKPSEQTVRFAVSRGDGSGRLAAVGDGDGGRYPPFLVLLLNALQQLMCLSGSDGTPA